MTPLTGRQWKSGVSDPPRSFRQAEDVAEDDHDGKRKMTARDMFEVGEARPEAVYQHASPVFFRVFQVAVIIRIWLTANTLNLFIPYSDGPGPVFLKIHPGSYLVIGLGCVALPIVIRYSKIRGNPLALGTLLLMSMPFVMLAWSLSHGRPGGVGYLIDATLIGPMTVVCLAYLTPEQRFELCKSLIFVFALNAPIVLFEFLTQIRLTPYPFREAVFRPAGLLGHPLGTGTLYTAVIPALFMIPMPNSLRWALTGLFSLAVLASQARAATIACLSIVVILFLATVRDDIKLGQRLAARTGLIISIAILTLPIIAIVLLESGFFTRILQGVVDESSMARIVVYDVFDYMTMDQFLYGMDIERALFLVRQGLKIDFIESAIVIYVINFGVIAGSILLASIVLYAVCLAWQAPWQGKLVAAAYLSLVLSNNGLATKSSGLMFLAVFTFGAATAMPPRRDAPPAQVGT